MGKGRTDMRNNWLVIVNEKCTINGGDRLAFKTRSEALNAAAFAARILYKAGASESHIFVVNRVETDAEPTCITKDELELRVMYHYSVSCEKTYKAMFLYDKLCDNQKLIEYQA